MAGTPDEPCCADPGLRVDVPPSVDQAHRRGSNPADEPTPVPGHARSASPHVPPGEHPGTPSHAYTPSHACTPAPPPHHHHHQHRNALSTRGTARSPPLPGRRETQAWDDDTEDLLERWRLEAVDNAAKHDRAARGKQRMRKRVALPSLLIPGIMAPFSQIFDEFSWFKYVNCAAFAVTGALSIVTTFFKYGEKMADHDRASLENAKLAQEITTVLTYKRTSRDDPKVVVAKVQGVRTNIMTNSPPLPPAPERVELPELDRENARWKTEASRDDIHV